MRPISMKWWVRVGGFASVLVAASLSAQSVDTSMFPYSKYGKPYCDLLAKPVRFYGPGREEMAPEVTEVRIGVFGPSRGEGISMRRGAQMAIDEANADGGYHGKPFKLVFRADDGPWGTAARQMVKLIYEDKVWAVLGSVSSPNTHLAEQIVTKAWVPLVAPISSDPTLTQINIPWIFRCMPNDRLQALALARYVFFKKGYTKVAGLAINDHYGRLGMTEFENLATRWGHPLRLRLKYAPGQSDFTQLLSRIEHAGVEAVVIWGTPKESALFIRQLRQRGMKQTVLGSGLLAVPEFLRAGGTSAEGVIVVLPYDSSHNGREFRQNFKTKYSQEPDLFAAYAYDGMRIIIKAVRAAGLNRIRIRDAIAGMNKFKGVTGTIRFSKNGDNTTAVELAVVRDGNFRTIP